MGQRLALGACTLPSPQLLLLDEPTAGVDPKARREFWNEIHALAAHGLAGQRPVSRVADIIRGRRAITADTALRLGEYFGMNAEFWLNLQAGYELRRLRANGWSAVRRRIRPREAA